MLVLCTLLIASGCNDETPSSLPITVDTASTEPQFNNDLIIGKLYTPDVSVPPTFQRDPRPLSGSSYTLRHLRTTDLDANASLASELCTDDMSDALRWSDLATANPAATVVVTILERDELYEMVRQNAGTTLVHRVFKCAYLNREGVDPWTVAGPAGVLASRQPAVDRLRELSEYLWQFSQFSNPGSAVLASTSEQHDDGWSHTLQLATLTNAGGQTAGCDLVERIDWQHKLSPDGQLTTQRSRVRQFDARLTPSGPEVCSDN